MKYEMNQEVNVRYKKYRIGEVVPSIITAIKTYRSRHMVGHLYEYCCSPLECEGFEHDDEEWIGNTLDDNIYDLPYIISSEKLEIEKKKNGDRLTLISAEMSKLLDEARQIENKYKAQ